jgi:four helix bundle protein
MNNSFEDFPVYQKSLFLIKEINSICEKVKEKDLYFLKDQIKRAASSIILNLAEGSGKWTKRDKANFYRISRGSAFECIAALDLFLVYQLIDEQFAEEIKDKLREIGADLQALVISIEKRIK